MKNRVKNELSLFERIKMIYSNNFFVINKLDKQHKSKHVFSFF